MAVDIMQIGRSGLSASKKALETTGHNISNANTDGFSRQRTEQATNPPVAIGQYVQGTGTYIRSIRRMHDDHIEKRLKTNLSQFNFDKEKSFQLTQIEEVFNELNADGINKVINNLFNSFRELSINPEDTTVRSIVRENGKIVTRDFKRSRDTLQQIINGMDSKISVAVEDINGLLKHIAKLNVNITEIEIGSGETGDLRDERDRAIRNLSEYMELQTWSDEKGHYVVNAQNVGTLVTGNHNVELESGYVAPDDAKNQGHVDIFIKGKGKAPLSEYISRGKLGAMIEVRDKVAKGLQHNLDYLAYNLVKTINAIHRKGFANIIEKNPDGSISQKTNNNFFQDSQDKPLQLHRAAEYIDLSDEVKSDVNNIVTALRPNSPGDNRIALAISKLQHEKVLNKGTSSFEEEYIKSIGKVAVLAAKSKVNTEQSEGILTQIKQLRERISGVSLDEETANMVRYQHAYDASARVIKAADDMFQTVLAIKRM